MGKTKATFGQQLLGIRFKPDQLTDTKLIFFQLFTVGANYLQSKIESASKNYFNNVNYLISLLLVNKLSIPSSIIVLALHHLILLK